MTNFYIEHLFTVNCDEEMKKRPGMAQLDKTLKSLY